VTGTAYFDQVAEAARFIRSTSPDIPTIAVVLGSGLGDFASGLQAAAALPYADIPNWPASRVVGHQGRLILGEAAGRRVAALAGRVHFYEGHDLQTVTFAMRVLGVLGVKQVILTNAAGGMNPAWEPGTLMVIDDHINLMGSNPLIGGNDDRFGVRFPDMTEVYSARLREIADQAGASLGYRLPHGIYAACHGPSYETPAEVRALRLLGADAVGMSTVPEAIVARHMGIEVLGISCITNFAAGMLSQPLNHAEVLETAEKVGSRFVSLLNAIISRF